MNTPPCFAKQLATCTQKYAEEMRGVHAMTPIVADDVITAIPLKCLITVEMGQSTEVSGTLARRMRLPLRPV